MCGAFWEAIMSMYIAGSVVFGYITSFPVFQGTGIHLQVSRLCVPLRDHNISALTNHISLFFIRNKENKDPFPLFSLRDKRMSIEGNEAF